MTPFGSMAIEPPRVEQTHAAAQSQPAEVSEIHTRILRCTLAVEDCHAYWRRFDPSVPISNRAQVAFEARWFGTKSESRVRTILTDMVERFDAYPQALQLIHEVPAVPAQLRPLICHVHTQLSDPVYRRFSGEFLPKCRAHGLLQVDRTQVADWVESITHERWSASTRLKFGTNLLAAAADAGIIQGKKDPRKLAAPAVPDIFIGYVLYLLRAVRIEGSLENNPYLRSLCVEPETFSRFGNRVPGLDIRDNAGVVEVTWFETDLRSWGRKYLQGAW